ncbi:MAG: hypothetical protein N2746_01455 [Deltaproteobacteria bacterium]|nr:hypothetical protein [Deltaproteobacteria bacterium]
MKKFLTMIVSFAFLTYSSCVSDEGSVRMPYTDSEGDMPIVDDIEVNTDIKDISCFSDVGRDDMSIRDYIEIPDNIPISDLDINFDVIDTGGVVDIMWEDIETQDLSFYVEERMDIHFEDEIDLDVEALKDVDDIQDVSQSENYDRLLVVTHPFGPDGATCGRNIEFFVFTQNGDLIRLNERIDVGDCPIKARFSPDGKFLFVITNNSHNPQSGTQSVVLLKKDTSGKYVRIKQFNEFSMQNPEYLAFNTNSTKVFVSDFDVEGNGGIHIIEKSGGNWAYKKEINIALPKAIAVLPDGRFLVAVAGKEPYDIAVIDTFEEKIYSQSDVFSDFVDALGIDVTKDGRYVVIPNASPYSELGNTLSILQVSYSNGFPTLSLKNILSDINEPSATLFSADSKYLVVTNFSKNYTSLFSFIDGSLNFVNRITSMPLADTMSMIRKGDFKDYFFVNALSDIHVLKIHNGQLVRVTKFALGSGSDNMLGDIDIEP